MKKHTVVIIGLGDRGIIHIKGILNNPSHFDIIGICDLNPQRLAQAADLFNIPPNHHYTNARTMMENTHPDVMVFATMPDVRLQLIELAAEFRVKGLMFEKPMATSVAEARRINEICTQNHIKTVVCQQHKYLRSFMELRKILDSGELGHIYQIEAMCQNTASQIGTHYMDYILWANNGIKADCVVGHAHGSFNLEDAHPAPDYTLGSIILKNGVRATLSCGYFSKPHNQHHLGGHTHNIDDNQFFTDNRLTVYGDTGYAWADTDGRWGAFTAETNGQIVGGDFGGFFEQEQFSAQDRYTEDFAKWLDDDACVHPSNVDLACHGYEIIDAIYISAIQRTRVDLPLTLPLEYDPLTKLKEILEPVAYRKFEKM